MGCQSRFKRVPFVNSGFVFSFSFSFSFYLLHPYLARMIFSEHSGAKEFAGLFRPFKHFSVKAIPVFNLGQARLESKNNPIGRGGSCDGQ